VHHGELIGQEHPGGDDGFSMIATVLSLVATALLVALLLGSTLHSGSTSSTRVANAPGVAEADSVQAQQVLSTGLTTADAAAIQSGGYGSLSPGELSASEPSVSFVAGPSSNASTVSMAVGQPQPGSSTGGPGGPGGSITLADRSSNGTCWLIWKGGGAGAWYGAQTGLSGCTAPALATAPSPGPVSSAAIGWQQGGFPAP
jgi:hypothetical protein